MGNRLPELSVYLSGFGEPSTDVLERSRTALVSTVTSTSIGEPVALHAGAVVRPTLPSNDRRRHHKPNRLLLRVAAVVVVVCAGAAAIWAESRPSGVTATSLIAGPTGPCAGLPPGCGSRQSPAAALATGSWSSFPAGPLSQRTGEVEVWTGQELIVWGGASGGSGQVLGDGAAYDPPTRTWRMLPPAPLSPRANAAAAWTGTEMIVVGGGDNDGAVVGGAAAYDPSTNAWTRLPSSPVEARTDATAIWTGRQLVVVGGSPGGISSDYRDIAAYDPASDTWTTLPPVPVVAAESDVIGVTPAWTGTELLVWVTWERDVPQVGNTGPGGHATRYVGTFVENTGYALAAGATAWQDLPPPGVATNYAVTAWTGSSVLVMGGDDSMPGTTGPPVVGAGASYDPTTASWTPVPSFSVVLRQWPAVWTGRAFVDTNYGSAGRHGTGHLSVYDPATGTWSVLPSAPAAIAGDDPQAVWTGSQLLVWGAPSEQLTVPTTASDLGTVCGYEVLVGGPAARPQPSVPPAIADGCPAAGSASPDRSLEVTITGSDGKKYVVYPANGAGLWGPWSAALPAGTYHAVGFGCFAPGEVFVVKPGKTLYSVRVATGCDAP